MISPSETTTISTSPSSPHPKKSVSFSRDLSETYIIPRDTLSQIARTTWLGSGSRNTFEFDDKRIFISYGIYKKQEFIILVSEKDPGFDMHSHFRETTTLSDHYPTSPSIDELKISSPELIEDIIRDKADVAKNVFFEYSTGLYEKKEQLAYAQITSKLNAYDTTTGTKRVLWSDTPAKRFITNKMLRDMTTLYEILDELLPPREVYLISPAELEPGVNYTYTELLELAKKLYSEAASESSHTDQNTAGSSTTTPTRYKHVRTINDITYDDLDVSTELAALNTNIESASKRMLPTHTQHLSESSAASSHSDDATAFTEPLQEITDLTKIAQDAVTAVFKSIILNQTNETEYSI